VWFGVGQDCVSVCVCVSVCSHPSASNVSNTVKVRFAPPKDIPVELYIKVFVGHKNRSILYLHPYRHHVYFTILCGSVCREHMKLMYNCKNLIMIYADQLLALIWRVSLSSHAYVPILFWHDGLITIGL